jgi:hypothetical protein
LRIYSRFSHVSREQAEHKIARKSTQIISVVRISNNKQPGLETKLSAKSVASPTKKKTKNQIKQCHSLFSCLERAIGLLLCK